MRWSAYEVFSILSGLSLIVAAFMSLPGEPARFSLDRVGVFVGGLGFVGYGWYAGHQTSGTFVFPIWIFIIPFVVVGGGTLLLVERAHQRTSTLNTGVPPVGSEPASGPDEGSSSTELAPGSARRAAEPGNAQRSAAVCLCILGSVAVAVGAWARFRFVRSLSAEYGTVLDPLFVLSAVVAAIAVVLALIAAKQLLTRTRSLWFALIAAVLLFVVSNGFDFATRFDTGLIDFPDPTLKDFQRSYFDLGSLFTLTPSFDYQFFAAIATLGWLAWVGALFFVGSPKTFLWKRGDVRAHG